jgi:hypothetical protein
LRAAPYRPSLSRNRASPNLLPPEIKARLLENRRKNAERIAKDGNTIDFHPVVRLM